ncbi:MAG TPA: LON peptidase substrate-binding domain-containing protein [Luteimonas sp.]
MEAGTLGLFPLHAVLVPGAALGLRVFEPRYLDLVRECGRSGGGFGVCLIMEGEEAGAAATPAAFGTEAMIEDFDTDDSGVLTLRVRGRRRFRVERTRVRDNGLVVGEVEWRDPDPDEELRPEHGLLALLLQRILEQAGGEHADAPASRFDDAAWVGWRLSELLPLADLQRQSLLQEDDPHARLQQLLGWVSEELK